MLKNKCIKFVKIFAGLVILASMPVFLTACSNSENNSAPQKQVNKDSKQELNKNYTSVLEYWNDTKKIRKNYNSISANMELKTAFSKGYSSSVYFAANKGNKFFTKLVNTKSSNETSSDFLLDAKKSFYDGGKNFIVYGFEDNNSVGINMNPSNSKISLENIVVQGIPEFHDFFNWYDKLLSADYTPKFTNQQEIYSGLSCRVIEFNKKKRTTTLKNGNVHNSIRVTTACVNDKYGVALYIKNLSYNADNKFDFYEQINSLSNIQVNNVNDSVFELPKKVFAYNTSLAEIEKELKNR